MAHQFSPDEYLRRAMEADEHEKLARDPEAQWAWERIVVGYLELAEMAARRASAAN